MFTPSRANRNMLNDLKSILRHLQGQRLIFIVTRSAWGSHRKAIKNGFPGALVDELGLMAILRVSKLLFSGWVTFMPNFNAPEQRFPTSWQMVFVRRLHPGPVSCSFPETFKARSPACHASHLTARHSRPAAPAERRSKARRRRAGTSCPCARYAAWPPARWTWNESAPAPSA